MSVIEGWTERDHAVEVFKYLVYKQRCKSFIENWFKNWIPNHPSCGTFTVDEAVKTCDKNLAFIFPVWGCVATCHLKNRLKQSTYSPNLFDGCRIFQVQTGKSLEESSSHTFECKNLDNVVFAYGAFDSICIVVVSRQN